MVSRGQGSDGAAGLLPTDGKYPPLSAPARPWRWRRPRPLGIVVLVVAGVLAVAVAVEVRAAAGLAPPAAAQADNGEPMTVNLDAGQGRTVYTQTRWGSGLLNFSPLTPGVVECRTATPQGDPVRVEPLDPNLRVNRWKAVSTLTAQRATTVAVTCRGPDGTRFGIGGPIPPRYLLDGVRRTPVNAGSALGWTLLALLIIGVATYPVTTAARRRIRWGAVPLLLIVAVTISFTSVVLGVAFAAAAVVGLGLLGLVLRGMGMTRPPDRTSWRGWAAAAAAVALLGGAWWWQHHSGSALTPAPAVQFDTGQRVTVQIPAEESRVVYGQRPNTPHREFRCSARGQQPQDLNDRAITDDIRVNDWMAVMSLKSYVAQRVEVSCSAPAGARFGIGAALPPRRILDGVDRFPGVGIAILAVYGALALAGLVGILAALRRGGPARPARSTWIYRFWMPLLFIAVVVITLNAVELGVGFGVMWFLFAGLFGNRDTGSGHTPAAGPADPLTPASSPIALSPPTPTAPDQQVLQQVLPPWTINALVGAVMTAVLAWVLLHALQHRAYPTALALVMTTGGVVFLLLGPRILRRLPAAQRWRVDSGPDGTVVHANRWRTRWPVAASMSAALGLFLAGVLITFGRLDNPFTGRPEPRLGAALVGLAILGWLCGLLALLAAGIQIRNWIRGYGWALTLDARGVRAGIRHEQAAGWDAFSEDGVRCAAPPPASRRPAGAVDLLIEATPTPIRLQMEFFPNDAAVLGDMVRFYRRAPTRRAELTDRRAADRLARKAFAPDPDDRLTSPAG